MFRVFSEDPPRKTKRLAYPGIWASMSRISESDDYGSHGFEFHSAEERTRVWYTMKNYARALGNVRVVTRNAHPCKLWVVKNREAQNDDTA